MDLDDLIEGRIPAEIADDPEKLGRVYAYILTQEPSMRDDPMAELQWRDAVRKNAVRKAKKENADSVFELPEFRKTDMHQIQMEAVERMANSKMMNDHEKRLFRVRLLAAEKRADDMEFINHARSGAVISGKRTEGRILNRINELS